MPIWSLTAERLAKLKEAIANKKAEHDELLALSDKDLWCRDLDDLMVEWENQLALDAEIKTSIRRMGRRVSKKIGAGRSRKAKDDDEYEPEKKSRGRPKAGAAKPAPVKETKTAERFAALFESKPKVKKEASPEVMELSDGFSDDDFAGLSRTRPAVKATSSQSQSEEPVAALSRTKPAVKSTSSQSQSEEPDNARGRRVAASKKRIVYDESESSDDDKMLGDIGYMVKGVKPKADAEDVTTGRVSLHAMARPEASQSNGGSSGLPKMKTKSAKSFDFDSPDDTNYELLAQSSPHKTAAKSDHIDSFLSDDDPILAPVKASTARTTSLSSAASKAPAGLATVKKARGRPAAAKAKAEPKAKATSKAVAKPAVKSSVLSPAAKAYAAKKAVKRRVLEDSDEDEEMEDAISPPPKPAARGRPGRAAAARRPIIIDDEDSSMMLDQQDEESDDPFEVDDDDD